MEENLTNNTIHKFLKDNLKIKIDIINNRIDVKIYLGNEKICSSWDTIN